MMELKDALEGYKLYARSTYAARTAELYEQKMAKVLEILGNVPVESISSKDLTKLMGYLKNEYVPFRIHHTEDLIATPTLANYWKSLRSFFKWANEELKIRRPDTKLPMPKSPLKEVRAFSKDEVKRLLYAAEWSREVNREGARAYRKHRNTGVRDLALLKFMLDTGLRIGELSRVQLEDVDMATGTVIIRPFGSGKKSKPRSVFLGASSKKTLWLYIAKRPEMRQNDLLWGLSSKRIYEIITDIGKAAGVAHCYPHRFRHTFAIEYLRSSRDPYALQRILGHSSMDMTRHYIDMLNEDLQRIQGTASPVDNFRL